MFFLRLQKSCRDFAQISEIVVEVVQVNVKSAAANRHCI